MLGIVDVLQKILGSTNYGKISIHKMVFFVIAWFLY